jgi:hypothetical protein
VDLGAGELVIILVIVGVLGLPIIGSIVGIRRAARRRREGVRSVGAVVLASIAGLIAVSTIGKSMWFFSVAACGLSFTWIVCAVLANRHVARATRPTK